MHSLHGAVADDRLPLKAQRHHLAAVGLRGSSLPPPQPQFPCLPDGCKGQFPPHERVK